MIIRLNVFAGILILFLTACSQDKQEPDNYLPNVSFQTQINITNIQYAALRQDRGYVYLPQGLRGIVVIRQNANSYLAFERNCTYQPSDSCARVEIDASTFFLTDPCCGSKFDLEGAVITGPARYPLRSYLTSLSGNMLYISN